jgi:serine protease Do
MEEENQEQPGRGRVRKQKGKLFFFGAVMLVIGLLAGSLMTTQSASANVFTDFFSKLFNSSASSSPTGSGGNGASSSVSLYQPVNDYESAVVAAVKSASPAVVSITISENVPVVEQCPYNPFEGLPPEFQQLFGIGGGSGSGNSSGGGGLTQPCDTGQTQLQAVGGGSGFIISSDGLILTNKHVVSDTGASYSVLTNDGKTYTAKVLARDPSQDLAVLKIDASGLPTVTLGDSSGLELGQTAIAIGNALGQFSNTVSVGVVSGLSRTVTAAAPDTGAQETITGVIQTDAAINPGNSGGPLLNLQGQVIGIDTAIASGAENIGFAIPINQAKHDISSVESTGQIQAPYLGVQYIPVTPALAQQQNLPVNQGALVRGSSTGPAVESDSPAAKAGVQAEDIITAVNSQSIDSTHDLGNVIDQYSVGNTVTLTINRGGKTITLQATLAQRPSGQ